MRCPGSARRSRPSPAVVDQEQPHADCCRRRDQRRSAQGRRWRRRVQGKGCRAARMVRLDAGGTLARRRGDHRFCALTFKLAERPIPLAEAAQRFGGVHALLAAVEPSTTTLSGGPLRVMERHSCVFEGRRFVHIVLLYKDEPISLLVPTDRDQLSSDIWRVGPPTDGRTASPSARGFMSLRSAAHGTSCSSCRR